MKKIFPYDEKTEKLHARHIPLMVVMLIGIPLAVGLLSGALEATKWMYDPFKGVVVTLLIGYGVKRLVEKADGN